MKRLLAVLSLSVLAIGCAHSQMPPTQHTVSLSWGATTSGGTGPYKYVMSRYTYKAGDNACPTPSLTTPNYLPLNSAAPVTATSYVDTTATSTTACYLVQAVDSVLAVSNPSNIAGPFIVPTIPGTPVTLGGSVTASLDVPQPALPKVGPDAPRVVAKLEGHIQ